MYNRLIKIDELTRSDHAFLDSEDVCFHMGEFTSHAGYGHSETNKLIINLKKPMDRRGKSEWKYKEKSIKTIATDLKNLLGKAGIEGSTFVPVPPSKIKGDLQHDDRVLRILQMMGEGCKCDLRELILQKSSTPAAHECRVRPTPQEIYANLIIDEGIANPPPSSVVIFDDILTAGAHYKAVKRKLIERFPDIPIFGVFAARRVLPNNAGDDFVDESR